MTSVNKIEQRIYDLQRQRDNERDYAREARQTGHELKARRHDKRAEESIASLKILLKPYNI